MDAAALPRRSIADWGKAVEPNLAMLRDIYRFDCQYGEFTIQLNREAAPETCAYFTRVFSSPDFARANIFRIVTETNSSPYAAVPIEVIQFGLDHIVSESLDQIVHETTEMTSLKHLKWTVSAARFGKGEVYPSCFICMRDEPELDHGGQRNGDGAGFAAFGKVISGFETLQWIFAQAEAEDYLKDAIPVEIVEK
ncbi:hypothetical protein A8B75_10755 [Sphingomonadales bacterium EhC05]|jgi:peptidyl-prolyl cis-trans isomerase A (cyclophilin A)|nr:hypothetical protein A8B75_10755 [Sphingomonadales bacterium EhC05]